MSKLGTVAVYIKSESCDQYLYCFENVSVKDISKTLNDEIEMFCPIYEWLTSGTNDDFVEDVDNFMSDLSARSWEGDDE